jgi:hypothetical protein
MERDGFALNSSRASRSQTSSEPLAGGCRIDLLEGTLATVGGLYLLIEVSAR